LEADRQKALRDAVLRACTGYNADEVIRAIASTSVTALIMIRMASRLSVRDRSPLRKHPMWAAAAECPACLEPACCYPRSGADAVRCPCPLSGAGR